MIRLNLTMNTPKKRDKKEFNIFFIFLLLALFIITIIYTVFYAIQILPLLQRFGYIP